ncbi:MAG: hypothetical protein LBG20_00190 [Holosporaceae bacterium]|jgi:F0F1-type ATP synthase membrane subunit b/b'|nr:hypothetical protein [Holosporaceae bacterium]
MQMDPGVSIVISFLGFSWLFWKRIYPQTTRMLDDHIEEVKNRINEAEWQSRAAQSILKKAQEKQKEMEESIDSCRKISQEKMKIMRRENDNYVMERREKVKLSLKNQLEAELEQQKEILLEQLSNQLIQKLSERIIQDSYVVLVDFSREDLQKLT